MAENTGAIDSISIEIGASATEAVKKINDVANALKKLKTERTSSTASNTSNMFKQIGAGSINALSKVELLRIKLAALQREMSAKMALGKIDTKGIANAALQIKSVQAQIDKATMNEAKAAQKAAKGEVSKEAKTSKTVSVDSTSSEAIKKQIKWTFSLRENIRLAATRRRRRSRQRKPGKQSENFLQK